MNENHVLLITPQISWMKFMFCLEITCTGICIFHCFAYILFTIINSSILVLFIMYCLLTQHITQYILPMVNMHHSQIYSIDDDPTLNKPIHNTSNCHMVNTPNSNPWRRLTYLLLTEKLHYFTTYIPNDWCFHTDCLSKRQHFWLLFKRYCSNRSIMLH